MIHFDQHEHMFGWRLRANVGEIDITDAVKISRFYYKLSCFFSCACTLGKIEGVESLAETSARIGEYLKKNGLLHRFTFDPNADKALRDEVEKFFPPEPKGLVY